MTGFSTRVMRAIHEEVAAPAPLAFPWARFLPGFLLNAVLLLATGAWLLLGPGGAAAGTPPAPASAFDAQTYWVVLAGLLVSISCLMTWVTSRWSSLRRRSSF